MQPGRLFGPPQPAAHAGQRPLVERSAGAALGGGGRHGGQYIEPMLWPRPMRLPSQCEVCRLWSRERLCPDCTARFAAPVPRCGRCALRLPAAAALCGACLRETPPQRRAVCVADYAFPWDALIADFKFRGQVELAGAFAPLLARAAATADTGPPGPRPEMLLPVPLAPARLRERGYNQAWELARRVARLCGIGARADLLSRPIDTAHQADLPRALRLANLRAAFIVEPGGRETLRGRHVALVDDVLTTGATVHECALVLLRAGAASVDAWVLARTPEH
jgi:ComF family protein